MAPDTVSADRALLRDVLRWARANGWRPRDRWEDGEVITWCTGPDVEPGVPGRYVCVGVPDHDFAYPTTLATERIGMFVPVDSVREAVDVLVALGVLPARFSSAHAAGRASVLAGAEEYWRVERNNFGTLTIHRGESDARRRVDFLRSEGIADVRVEHRLVPQPTVWQPVDETEEA